MIHLPALHTNFRGVKCLTYLGREGIEAEIATLRGSELSLLKARAESERVNGRDLLALMAEQLDARIVQLRQKRDAPREFR
jgi:hypothetical protein